LLPCLIPAALLLAGTPALLAQGPPTQEAGPPAGQAVTGSSEQAPPPPPSPQFDGALASPPQAAQVDKEQDRGIVVTGRKRNPADPLAHLNAKSFAVTETIDDNITAPLAHAYEHALPKPVRNGVHNFLGNLHEPVVFVNFLLQHKIGKAAETFARFAIDTTAGVGGVIDVAKRRPFNLPRRPNGFADTLSFYGVKPGAFLYLPLMGPTTVRDLAGGLLDRLLLPSLPGTPFARPSWAVPAGVAHTLDKRAEFDGELARERASGDPYAARRDYYLLKRQAEIDALHGKAPPTPPPPSTPGA